MDYELLRKQTFTQAALYIALNLPKVGKAIYVWEFYEAPQQLRALSQHGGDENTVYLISPDAEIPYEIRNVWEGWDEEPEEIPTTGGWKIVITAHA